MELPHTHKDEGKKSTYFFLNFAIRIDLKNKQ